MAWDLIEQIVPVCAHSLMHPFQWTTLIRLGECLPKICRKVVNPRDMLRLDLLVNEATCFLKIYMLPTFFDLMKNVLIHLVSELSVCGPIGGHWMFLLKRYIGLSKGWVCNKAWPDAYGYVTEETLSFCIQYYSLYSHSNCCMWETIEVMIVEGCTLEHQGNWRELSPKEVKDIHNYNVKNFVEILMRGVTRSR